MSETIPPPPSWTSRLWSRLRRGDGGSEAVCGKCSYIVTNRSGFTCPECGSDLRDVGIVRRALPPADRIRWKDIPLAIRRRYTRTQVVLASLAVLLSILLSWGVRSWIDTRTWTFNSKSTLYKSLDVQARFRSLRLLNHTYTQHPQSLPVRLILTRLDGTQTSADVELPALRLRYDLLPAGGGVPVRSDSILNEESLQRWLRDQGKLNVADPQVAAEANAVVAALKLYDGRTPAHMDALAADLRDHLIDATGPFRSWGWGGRSSDSWFNLAVSFLPIALYAIASNMLGRRALEQGKRQLIADGLWDEPPSTAAVQSRTLTILFSDMKDFTVRSASSSRASLVRLLRVNRRLVDKAVTRFGGAVVKTAGDGVVARFDSATNAVLAALEVQHLAALHNRTAAIDEALELRVAVSTGEVTVEDDDVYGLAVNVAARLQAHAPVGEVYLTDATRQSMTGSEIQTELVAATEFKGVPGPIQVWRAVPRQGAS